MAVIRVRKLTWAKYVSGGNGSALVYEEGKVDPDKIVRVDQEETRSSGRMDADDHKIDGDNSVTAASVSIELANLDDDMKRAWIGMVEEGEDLVMTTEESPYVGVGFIYGKLWCGTKKYKAYWYPKVQFGLGSRSFNTKGENTEFQTESAEGDAVAVRTSENGVERFFYESKDLETEAAALTWLRGHAGISA